VNQPINRPAHRNTDSEKTGVIPPVKSTPPAEESTSRGPIPLMTFLALMVLVGGVAWATAISDLSQPVKIVVSSVCVASILLLASGGVTNKRSKL